MGKQGPNRFGNLEALFHARQRPEQMESTELSRITAGSRDLKNVIGVCSFSF
jgi:hypothetical protein